jgi:hypothetical protein
VSCFLHYTQQTLPFVTPVFRLLALFQNFRLLKKPIPTFFSVLSFESVEQSKSRTHSSNASAPNGFFRFCALSSVQSLAGEPYRSACGVCTARASKCCAIILAGEPYRSACRVCTARASKCCAIICRFLVTHSILLVPLHLPCVTVCQHISNAVDLTWIAWS